MTETASQDTTAPVRNPAGPLGTAGAAAIEVSGLRKRYGATWAVDSLSFTASYGRITAFLGPNGAGKTTTLRTLVGRRGQRADTYSLGMRQRLGLAAALLGDPRVLILDEPANGLDPQGIRWLRDLLRSLAAEGRAVLVASHALAEVAQTVDDVVIIRDGRSVLQAPLARLLADHAPGIRVTGPDAGRLADLLRGQGARVTAPAAGTIMVGGLSEKEILHVVAASQLVVSELSSPGSGLEDIYLELTGNPNGDTP